MCLIAFDWQPDADSALTLIANRDEFFERPTLPLHWWGGPELLAGKDLREGGAWMGVTRMGRFAALTNYRSPNEQQADKRSRGHIVTDFLCAKESAEVFLSQLATHQQQYNGFNLICGDLSRRELWYFSNRSPEHTHTGTLISPGAHGLSNGLLDTPWPKVIHAKAALAQAAPLRGPAHTRALWAALMNEAVAADAQLPHTGVSLEWERRLSSAHIPATSLMGKPIYGTRSSSVLQLGKGVLSWYEWTLNGDANANVNGDVTGDASAAGLQFSFALPPRRSRVGI